VPAIPYAVHFSLPISVGDTHWSGFGIIFLGVLLDKPRSFLLFQRILKKMLWLYDSAYYYKMVGVSIFMVKISS
jgi:hypothetical protein